MQAEGVQHRDGPPADPAAALAADVQQARSGIEQRTHHQRALQAAIVHDMNGPRQGLGGKGVQCLHEQGARHQQPIQAARSSRMSGPRQGLGSQAEVWVQQEGIRLSPPELIAAAAQLQVTCMAHMLDHNIHYEINLKPSPRPTIA